MTISHNSFLGTKDHAAFLFIKNKERMLKSCRYHDKIDNIFKLSCLTLRRALCRMRRTKQETRKELQQYFMGRDGIEKPGQPAG